MAEKEDNPQENTTSEPEEGKKSATQESPQEKTPLVVDGVEYTEDELRNLKKEKEDKDMEIERLKAEVESKREKVTEISEEDIFSDEKKLAEALYDDPKGVLAKHRQKIEKDMEAKFNAKLEATINPLIQKHRDDQKERVREKYSKNFDKAKEKEVDEIFDAVRPDLMRQYLLDHNYIKSEGAQSLSDYELAYHLSNLFSGILPGGTVATFSESPKRHSGTPTIDDILEAKGYKPDEIATIKGICKQSKISVEEYLKTRENPEKDYDDE